jgi:hypothetical protein
MTIMVKVVRFPINDDKIGKPIESNHEYDKDIHKTEESFRDYLSKKFPGCFLMVLNKEGWKNGNGKTSIYA